MKMIVGLGNPGEKYKQSRHNVGFRVVEEIFEQMTNDKFQMTNNNQISNFKFQKKSDVERVRIGELVLVKPQTFMNRSGEAIQKVKRFYQVALDDLYVVHDDLDIRLGGYKIVFGRGPKVHNGVNSVEQALGTEDFWRVRVGIENRSQQIPNDKSQMASKSQISNNQMGKQTISGERYVLGNFLEEEREVVNEVIEKAVEELLRKLQS